MSSAEPKSPPPKQPRRRLPWPIILGLIALLTVPFLVHEWPREIVRWKHTRAVQTREKGDKDAAYTILDEILREDPTNIDVLLTRASWQMDDKQGDRALADIEDALKLDPDDIRLFLFRGQVRLALGKFPEAAKDADAILEKLPPERRDGRAMMLNHAAYSRALGNVELDQALSQITEALSLNEDMACYDTRGYVLWRLERNAEALTDMNRAIRMLDEEIKNFKSSGKEGAEKIFFRNAAVIYYHRGLVYQALGKEAEAEKDFEQVREWGEEPGEELY